MDYISLDCRFDLEKLPILLAEINSAVKSFFVLTSLASSNLSISIKVQQEMRVSDHKIDCYLIWTSICLSCLRDLSCFIIFPEMLFSLLYSSMFIDFTIFALYFIIKFCLPFDTSWIVPNQEVLQIIDLIFNLPP